MKDNPYVHEPPPKRANDILVRVVDAGLQMIACPPAGQKAPSK